MEINNRINFLDVTLIRSGNSIMTNWYTKPSNSSRILNFHSNHSTQLKRNIVFNLTDRAINLSHKQFHKDNISLIKKILLENSYPIDFINANIKERLVYINSSANPSQSSRDNSPICSVSIPLLPSFFQKSSKLLKKYNIKIIPKMCRKLSNIVTLGKDKPPKEEITGVVYKFDCNKCPASYIGKQRELWGTESKNIVIQETKNLSFRCINLRIRDIILTLTKYKS